MRDSMLKRHMLRPSVCVSICVTGAGYYSVETTERIELVFLAHKLSFYISYTMYKEIRVSPKLKALPARTPAPTLDLE